MSGLFVTATGTDVGKTFVACGLIRALRRQGRPVDALKPVMSGFSPLHAFASDAGQLLDALGRPVGIGEIDRVAPWRFEAPLSPDMAARREGRSIDYAALLAYCRAALAEAPGTLLIEGVGGIMVPLDQWHTVLDWVVGLGLPAIAVAGSYLGTISHSLSALDVLARRGIAIRALVVSESAGSTVPLDETVDTIARFAPTVEVVPLPRAGPGQSTDPIFDRLAALV